MAVLVTAIHVEAAATDIRAGAEGWPYSPGDIEARDDVDGPNKSGHDATNKTWRHFSCGIE